MADVTVLMDGRRRTFSDADAAARRCSMPPRAQGSTCHIRAVPAYARRAARKLVTRRRSRWIRTSRSRTGKLERGLHPGVPGASDQRRARAHYDERCRRWPIERSRCGVEAGVARLTLNRPDRLNRFNVEMHAEVRDGARRRGVARDGARVLVLTGAGRGFCAGQDLGDRAVAPGGAARRPRRIDRAATTSRWCSRCAALPMPVDRRGQWRRGRRRREHRARLRSRDRDALRELSSSRSRSSAWCRIPAGPGTCRVCSAPRARMGLAMLGDKLSAEQAAAVGT